MSLKELDIMKNKTLVQQISEFLGSIDSFDEENSLTRYDRAVIADAMAAINRIQRIRDQRDSYLVKAL